MTNLLTLEASSDICSATLTTPTTCQSIESNELRSHSQLLLPYVDQLLNVAALTINDLDFIACSQGPGSFTGLRICFSVAQGLAYAANIPMVTVCSLQSMALLSNEQCFDAYGIDSGHLTIAVIDARMDQVYWAAYLYTSGPKEIFQVLSPPQLHFINDCMSQITQLIQQYSSCSSALVGSGVSLLNTESFPIGVRTDASIMPTSVMSSRLALMKWKNGQSVSADRAELVYLRDTITWQKRIKIRS